MTMTVNMTYQHPEGAPSGSITLLGDQSKQALGSELAIDLND